MRILAIDKYEEPVVKKIENTLEDMQKYVMGHIETVTLSGTAVLVCNEDGRLVDFTPNRILKIGHRQEVIRGDFFICGWTGDEFCDISDENVEQYTKMFSKPEALFMPIWVGTSRVWKTVSPEEEGSRFVFYELWQCDTDYTFTDSAYALGKYEPNFSDYHKVYRGVIPVTEGFDAKKACEQLYMEHNGIILDRKGRSMSVSDILIMDSPEGKRWFYVNIFGFTKVCFDDDGKMIKEKGDKTMTRGNFVLLTNDANWMSVQFNGDMYPSYNGKLVYYMLQNQVTDYDSLADAIRHFDDACFGYAREYGEDISPRKAPDEIDFSHDYFKIYHSDYLYIKNAADFPIMITDSRRQKHEIQPDEIQVWYFGELEETDPNDLVLDKEDEKILGISHDEKFSDKVKKIFADCDDAIKNPPANMTQEENVIMAAITTLRAVLEGKV